MKLFEISRTFKTVTVECLDEDMAKKMQKNLEDVSRMPTWMVKKAYARMKP